MAGQALNRRRPRIGQMINGGDPTFVVQFAHANALPWEKEGDCPDAPNHLVLLAFDLLIIKAPAQANKEITSGRSMQRGLAEAKRVGRQQVAVGQPSRRREPRSSGRT